MKLKNLAYVDRPNEKLITKGASALSDSELIAIILNSGTKAKSALDIAQELVTKDERNIGLPFITQYSINELMKINGIGKHKAVLLKAVCEFAVRYSCKGPNPQDKITTPEELSRVFKHDLQYKKQEIIQTAILDTKNRVIKVVTNSIGTVNSNSISYKEILTEPVSICAPKIAVAHNHPSGDATPSREDVDFTNGLIKACHLFGIEFLDHIIIGDNSFTSLKSLGLI